MASTQEGNRVQWFVMRDLKRSNAKLPAYKLLREEQFEVFVPMKWELVNQMALKSGENFRCLQTCYLYVQRKRNLILL